MRLRRIHTALTALALAITAGAFTIASPASAGSYTPNNGTYRIEAVAADKYLAVPNAGGSGTGVIIWPGLYPGPDQKWFLEQAGIFPGSGYYIKAHYSYGTLCLDVPGSNASSGVRLQVWDCNRSDAQRFYLYDGGIRIKIVTALNSNLCLDVHTYNVGEPVQLWSCNGTLPQAWSFSRQ